MLLLFFKEFSVKIDHLASPQAERTMQETIDAKSVRFDVYTKDDKRIYTKLKDSYVIFLCLTDIFQKNLPVYTFENVCREDKKIKLNDRAFKVFFNAEECDKLNSEDEKNFFRFLKGEKAETGLSRSIEEKVEFAKKNALWRRQYMTWQQTIDEEKDIAREEGARENAIAIAKNLLCMNLLTPKQISQAVSLSLDEVLALKEELEMETES